MKGAKPSLSCMCPTPHLYVPPPWTINEPGESSVHPYPSSNSVSNETGFRYIQTTQQSNYIPWTRTKLFLWYPWNLNLIKTGEDIILFRLEKCLILWVSPLLLKKKKCASHFRRGTTNENKQLKETKTWISKTYLIRQRFQGYRCKSGFAFFALKLREQSTLKGLFKKN